MWEVDQTLPAYSCSGAREPGNETMHKVKAIKNLRWERSGSEVTFGDTKQWEGMLPNID